MSFKLVNVLSFQTTIVPNYCSTCLPSVSVEPFILKTVPGLSNSQRVRSDELSLLLLFLLQSGSVDVFLSPEVFLEPGCLHSQPHSRMISFLANPFLFTTAVCNFALGLYTSLLLYLCKSVRLDHKTSPLLFWCGIKMIFFHHNKFVTLISFCSLWSIYFDLLPILKQIIISTSKNSPFSLMPSSKCPSLRISDKINL